MWEAMHQGHRPGYVDGNAPGRKAMRQGTGWGIHKVSLSDSDDN